MRENITVIDHPLLKHKISMMRDKNTGTNEFRKLTEEVAMLMGYEALRDLPTEEIEIETPIEKCCTPFIAGKKPALVPILRAGLGMVSGMLTLVPAAKVGHIGMYRDEVTKEPKEYYSKLPQPIEDRLIIVLDPMTATGGSACDALAQIKKSIVSITKKSTCAKIMSVASQANKVFVQIYVAQIDRCLNDDAYICPGLGDAGDRIFGTF